ncbi:ABC transporter transmembrane domain-containing protein [Meridianimarinicoccus roseus]|nr:ABC transporter transmembrane domain-containing protein [Meridianimarinicoccus roseus]
MTSGTTCTCLAVASGDPGDGWKSSERIYPSWSAELRCNALSVAELHPRNSLEFDAFMSRRQSFENTSALEDSAMKWWTAMAGIIEQDRARMSVVTPRLGVTVLAGSLALNILALALPLVMLQIFDRVIPFSAHATLGVFLVCLIAVALAEFCLRVCRIVLVGHAGTRYETELSDAACRKMLDTVPRDHERDGIGVHFERFGAVAQLREHYAGQGRLLVIDLPFTMIFVAMIGLIGGILIAVPLMILAVIFCVTLVMKRRQSRVLEQRKVVDGRRYSFLIEFLSQIATVKANLMEQQMLRRYELLIRQSAAASRAIISLSGLSQSLGAVLGQASVAAMGLCGAWLVLAGQLGVGELAACMLLNGRTTQPLLKLLGVMMQGESVVQARNRLAELDAMPMRPRIAPESPLRGAITLRDLGFSHPKSGAILFQGVNADIAPGQCVRIEGTDGGGRASLMRMILAEQAPSVGVVRVDGLPPIQAIGHRGPGGIGFVDQVPVAFRGTILDNILLFGTVPDRDGSMEICDRLGLDAEVRAMPLGYQTIIGPDAGPQSRGFLQKVGLARALVMRPRILLLNHATSAMDDPAANRAADLLAEFAGTTTILLASTQPQISALAESALALKRRSEDAYAVWDEDRAVDAAARRQIEALSA